MLEQAFGMLVFLSLAVLAAAASRHHRRLGCRWFPLAFALVSGANLAAALDAFWKLSQ